MSAARRVQAPLCAALVAFAVGLPALDGGFVRDDFLYVATNPHVADPATPWARAFTEPFAPHTEVPLGLWRPLATLSWRLDRAAAGGVDRTRTFHAQNLLWNAAAAALLASLLLTLGATPLLAGAAAALFGAHPARSEAVLWISGRSELLMTCGALAACLGALRAPDRWKGPAAAAGVAWAFASKEQGAAVVPLLAFLPGLALAARVRVVATSAAVAFALFVWRGYVVGSVGPTAAGTQVLPDVASAVERLPYGLLWLGGYARLLFLPFPLVNEYDDPRTPLAAGAVAAGAFVALALVVSFAAARRAPRLAFAAALFGAPLGPVLNVLYRTGETFAERFLCLPLAGAAALAALVAARRTRVGGPVLVALALVAAALTADRARDWTSQRALAEAAVRDAPEIGGSWHMVAADRMDELGGRAPSAEDVAVAEDALRRAVRLAPHRAQALANLGSKRSAEGETDLYGREGRAAFAAAIANFDAALAADPTLPTVRWRKGSALLRLERRDEAEAAFREELARDPRQVGASIELAGLLDAAGRFAAAAAVRREALATAEELAAKNPDETSVWRSIGHLRMTLGDPPAAEAALGFGRDATRDPEERALYAVNLAQLRKGLKRVDEAAADLAATADALARELAAATTPLERRRLLSAAAMIDVERGDRAAAAEKLAAAAAVASGKERRSLEARLAALR
jgi:tetratricopeptide (TPR) repeat protein